MFDLLLETKISRKYKTRFFSPNNFLCYILTYANLNIFEKLEDTNRLMIGH